MCFQFPLSDTETHDYVLTCASGLHQREKNVGAGLGERVGGFITTGLASQRSVFWGVAYLGIHPQPTHCNSFI